MTNLAKMLALSSIAILLCGCSLKPFGIAPIVIIFGKVEMAGSKVETRNNDDGEKTVEEKAAAQIKRITADE